MFRRNPIEAPKKKPVKTVFHASNAVTTAAGYAAVSGFADAILKRFRMLAGSEDGKNYASIVQGLLSCVCGTLRGICDRDNCLARVSQLAEFINIL